MSIAFAAGTADPMSHVVQHPLHQVESALGTLTVFSDQIFVEILAGLLVIFLIPLWLRRRRGADEVGRLITRGPGMAIEAICEYLRENVAKPNLHHHTDRFIKFIWSLFFFILAMNLLGLVPIAQVSSLFGVHLGGTPTANIWTTATLAIITFLMMVINGLRLAGIEYLKHFNPGPALMAPLMVPIELVGLIAKPFALAVRLFANMIAGHVLLAVILSFIIDVGSAHGPVAGFGISVPVVLASVAINMLELFVAFLQAYIFTFLTTLFLGMSVVPHPEGEHAH